MRYGREAGRRAFARSGAPRGRPALLRRPRALARLPETPETRALAIDLRLDLRYPLSPLGEFGRMLDYLKRSRGARPPRRRSAAAPDSSPPS